MQNLPIAEVYEKEFAYMPWGILVKRVQQMIITAAPANGRVLDLLCGPGYLLGQLQQRRPDMAYTGVDLEQEFISYAQTHYPGIEFIVADAAEWETSEKYDVVLCTAGLHHLPYDKQESFLKRLGKLLQPNGMIIVADPAIDDYANESERMLAGAKLGYKYLIATIKNGATVDVIGSAVDILKNDVLLVEYKSSVKKLLSMFKRTFSEVTMEKTWPEEDTEYGDYIFTLKP